MKTLLISFILALTIAGYASCELEQPALETTTPAITVEEPKVETEPVQAPIIDPAQNIAESSRGIDKYTVGPDDIIEILVRRHEEFSGKYIINKDGKIQYKFVGDIDVNNLTKDALQEKLTKLLSEYIVQPEVNVTIVEYRSKTFYVIGEVSRPGKYFMMDNNISIREAVVMAGLPTMSAAMRKCRLIHPDDSNTPKYKNVDVYKILYGGNLKNNISMYPGDVLYVPATVMAKVMRVISPISAPLTTAASTGKTVLSAGTIP